MDSSEDVSSTDIESEPLLSATSPSVNHGGPQKQQREISTLRARLILFLAHLMMMSGGITYTILLAQYLVDRIAKDTGYANLSSVDHCSTNSSDLESRRANEVQQKATDLITYLNFAQTIPAFFACFLVGSYSDYIGRRIALLVPMFTAFFNAGVMSLVIGFNLDLNYLYLGFGVDGLSGSWTAVLVVEFAITADISVSKDSRTLWIFLLLCCGSIMTSGVTLGTSYIIDSLGFFYASLVPTGLAFATFVVLFCFFQDTLTEKPASRVWSPAFHCRRLFGLYVLQGSRRHRATLIICMCIFVTSVMSELNRETMDSLYQLHEPFCWDARRIGQYNSIRAGGGNLLGALWLAVLRRCLSPEVIGVVGIVFQASAYAFEGFITKSWQFYIVPALLVPAISTVPIIRATMSLLVNAEQQGALFSSIAVVESLCALVAGTLFTKVYSATVSSMPGAVFLVTAAICITAAFFYIVYFIIREKPTKENKATYDYEKEISPPDTIDTDYEKD